ncbi:MAG: S8 family serine peptidase [Burkholderiales bacterium]|nr:S8 family serine peptidase [Burkholderiales bacterium]
MPRAQLAFEGLIVNLGVDAPAAERDPQAIAARVAALCEATLGGEWRARPLGAGAADFLAQPVTRKRIQPGPAWEMVAKLRGRREVFDAEPAFRLPGLPVEPREAPRLTGARLARSALIPEADLPESDDCEWSVTMCRAREAWARSEATPGAAVRGAGIVVAHPDTGYTEHPELYDPARLLVGESFDFLTETPGALDPLEGANPGHGTSTGSVIMSAAGPAAGAAAFVTGIAPQASLVPLRVNDSVIYFSYANLCAALYYAVAHGYHVVSMSLGGPWGSGALARAVRHAVDNGLVLLAASGNYWPWVVYPARYDEVIAVTACNAREEVWRHATAGAAVDVTAPGESVWRALTRGLSDFTVERGSGTSYATAVVAGVCALWLAHFGRANLVARYGAPRLAAVFKEQLMTYGVRTPAGWPTGECGAGIVRADALLAAELPATAVAGSMRRLRTRPAPRVENDFDAVASYFPDADPGRVRRALTRLFGVDERGLARLLGEVGDELGFHLATDPALRAALIAGTGVAARRDVAPAARALARASRTLRARLAGG